MQHRRVQVANVDRIFGNVVAEVISFTVACTALDAAAGQVVKQRGWWSRPYLFRLLTLPWPNVVRLADRVP